MEKYIYNEQNGLWYELQGDYYIPCLVLDEEDTPPIGMWGRKHLRYIKEHRRALYTTLLISGKLNSHLAEIDNQVFGSGGNDHLESSENSQFESIKNRQQPRLVY